VRELRPDVRYTVVDIYPIILNGERDPQTAGCYRTCQELMQKLAITEVPHKTFALERVRDALAVRLREAQAELGRRGEAEEANRGLLESMILDPRGHRWVRISAEDIGEPMCRHWHSRPRWGILGMLMGWWRVKLSSGCPLAKGPRAPEQETQEASPTSPGG